MNYTRLKKELEAQQKAKIQDHNNELYFEALKELKIEVRE